MATKASISIKLEAAAAPAETSGRATPAANGDASTAAKPSPSLTPRTRPAHLEKDVATAYVKWFDAKKGFGFLSSKVSKNDIFVHQSEILGEGYRRLIEGQIVEFVPAYEPIPHARFFGKHKMIARFVSAPGGQPIAPPDKHEIERLTRYNPAALAKYDRIHGPGAAPALSAAVPALSAVPAMPQILTVPAVTTTPTRSVSTKTADARGDARAMAAEMKVARLHRDCTIAPYTKHTMPTGRQNGTCAWFDVKRGFGFISPSDGSDNVFVHQSGLDFSGFRALQTLEEVEFEFVWGDHGLLAQRVTGRNGRPLVYQLRNQDQPNDRKDRVIGSKEKRQEQRKRSRSRSRDHHHYHHYHHHRHRKHSRSRSVRRRDRSHSRSQSRSPSSRHKHRSRRRNSRSRSPIASTASTAHSTTQYKARQAGDASQLVEVSHASSMSTITAIPTRPTEEKSKTSAPIHIVSLSGPIAENKQSEQNGTTTQSIETKSTEYWSKQLSEFLHRPQVDSLASTSFLHPMVPGPPTMGFDANAGLPGFDVTCGKPQFSTPFHPFMTLPLLPPPPFPPPVPPALPPPLPPPSLYSLCV